MTFLAKEPTGESAVKAVLSLNKNLSKEYLETPKLKYSDGGDDFSELETILRNQLPLNKKYKLKSEIDDVVTRQVQAIIEYATTHTVKNGFF